jgi:S-ribosylhomocysteine lyase
MNKIPSFKRNHNDIFAGLYLQETKKNIDIYDLRFVKPNTEFIPIDAMHTIEHLFATWLKTESDIKEQVISFNPAGCQTMFYLEVFNDKEIDVAKELLKCIYWCLKQNTVAGATKEECGNYKSHNLDDAKVWLKRYAEVLNGFYKKS